MATSTAAGKKRMISPTLSITCGTDGNEASPGKAAFRDLGNLATSEVKSNGEFVLPGFGKLVRSERKAREGRNPATGETIQIPAKTTLSFVSGRR